MIYCVEDERNIRELLIYTLETTGFKARGFGNGNELMKVLKEEIPCFRGMMAIPFWNS